MKKTEITSEDRFDRKFPEKDYYFSPEGYNETLLEIKEFGKSQKQKLIDEIEKRLAYYKVLDKKTETSSKYGEGVDDGLKEAIEIIKKHL